MPNFKKSKRLLLTVINLMFIFCLSNCKKKKGPSEPTQETKKTSCTNLNLFGIDKLPAVDPAYLKVGSMQVDQFRNNNYSRSEEHTSELPVTL